MKLNISKILTLEFNLLTLLYFITIFHLSKCARTNRFQPQNLGKAKLVLFQGHTRHEVIGTNCPVGISLVQPERFSCACVNGLWGFYDTICAPPLAVVGGNNYCFQMPNINIQQIRLFSNPIRPLDNSLTVFEGEKESVKTRVYRNIQLPLNGTDYLLTLNSSWTLNSADNLQSVCLNSRQKNLTVDEDVNFLNLRFCNFVNISAVMPLVGSISQGCADSDFKVDPDECQAILPSNDEQLCTSSSILEAYASYLAEDKEDSFERRDNVEFKQRFKHPVTSTTTSTTTLIPISTTTATSTTMRTTLITTIKPVTINTVKTTEISKIIKIHKSRGRDLLKDKINTHHNKNETKNNHVITISESSILRAESIKNMINIMNKEWKNPGNFLVPPELKSEPQIMDQIWKYEKMNINNNLDIKPLSTSDITMSKIKSPIHQLLEISRDILGKMCPLVTTEYLSMALDAFLTVQEKNFRWHEPYIDFHDFSRIYTSLLNCKSRAVMYNFATGKDCITRNPEKVANGMDSRHNIIWIDTQHNFIPKEFDSKGYEPIVETIWKVFVSTHSYCYSDFSNFYNDHHKYTASIIPSFVNGIHKLWIGHRDKQVDLEYGGVMGPAEVILADLDKCAAATRITSGYPFHLTRPTAASNGSSRPFLLDTFSIPNNFNPISTKSNPSISNINAEIASSSTVPSILTPHPLLISTPSTTAEQGRYIPKHSDHSPYQSRNRRRVARSASKANINFKRDWKKSRKIFQGLAFCLKKYDETRLQLDQNCDL